MALSILDGNQSATTLSTILSSGQHITAHTVVSLGTQAITDMRGAVSGSVVSISNLPSTQTIAGTVTANLDPNASVIASQIETGIASYAADLANNPLPISGTVTIGAGTAQIGSVTASISGTVTVGNTVNFLSGSDSDTNLSENIALAIVSNNILGITNALPAGTNRIGVVTIGAGTVTIGAGTAQIGSVTVGNATTSSAVFTKICGEIAGAGPNETIQIITDSQGMLYSRLAPASNLTADPVVYDPVAGNAYVSVRQTASVTIGSLPAISGTVTANINDLTNNLFAGQIGDALFGADQLLTALTNLPISGTVTANTFALQGTAVTTSNFTSTTASTVLAGYNATREVLTIFNEGAGNLHICAGATCTTIAYQVRLSAGDYYEVPNHQTTITHSAVFATAGTARVTEVS